MIYLARHQLLFVKPKKTAGTSVEVALSCNATPEDIVTPLIEEDETVRWNLGGQFPVNWAKRKSDEAAYRVRFEQYLKDGIVPRRYLGLKAGRLWNRHRARFVNHMPPAEVARRAGRAFVEQSFLVTMCRHPYEQIVSFAFHQHKLHGRPIEKCIAEAVARPPMNDPYVFGPKKPDHVIRYEHLADDLAELENRFGLALLANLPQTKHLARNEKKSASDILSDAQKSEIKQRHFRTFETFGYGA